MKMSARKACINLARAITACLAVAGLMASEYQGRVTAGGLPLPGATVTATRGDQKAVTTTDDRGAFRFAELADGNWTIEVEMLGFARISHEVGVARVAPSPEWEMKILSEEALLASLRGAGTPAAAPVPAAPAARAASAGMAKAGPNAGPQREQARPQWRQGQSANGNGRTNAANGNFQRLDVNQSAASTAFGSEGVLKAEETSDLSQSAANSFIVQGSVSSAVGIEQHNDWGFGHGMGMEPPGGPGMMGMGGPGMPGQMSDGPSAVAQSGPRMVAVSGGPGGRGGFGGPGGPGGFRGGPGGPGGPGGHGGPMGERFGGRDRRDWQGRPNSRAFGNARRDPRSSYNGFAFFSLDNSAWDARSFSVTGASVAKPSYANARAGFLFGGPLRIPKLVSPEKHIFFMVNYFVLRNRTGTVSQPVNMPSALERSGDFSQTLVQGTPAVVYDPATGAPFPGNRIPLTRINSASAALLQYYPSPNLPYAGRNYQTAWSGSNNSQMLNVRLSNIRVGSRNRFDGSLGYQGRESSNPNLFQFLDTGSGRGINASLGWSHNFTTRVISNLRYTFSRNRDRSSPYFANRQNVAASLGIAGTSQNPVNWGPPNLRFTNYAGLSDGNSSSTRNQTSSIGESLLWVRGQHNLSFGGDLRRQQFNQFADSNGRGTYTFNGSVTSKIVNGVAQPGTGYDLADFLLGIPTTGSIRYGNPDKYFRGFGYDLFLNDDWRIGTKFSLTAGLRWEYATPVTELYNRLVNLRIAPGFTAINAVTPGDAAGLPAALIHPDRNNFSPRMGFAWRPSTKRSLVVRGGYGLYYNTSVYNVIAANMAQQPPFAQVLSASSSAAVPLTIQNGFTLASSQGAGSTYAIDPNYRVGYAQTWTLSVQHDLPFSLFGTVGYLGTKGTRLDQQFIPNSVAPGAAVSPLPHGYIYETSNGNSIYHAAQFQLNRRFHSGVMAHASYQFSKSIDNAGTGGRGQGGTPVAQNWLDLSAERGLSSFDSRHNLSLMMQYSTGMGARGGTLLKGWQGALAKDWTLSANISVRSGNPFTATVGGNRSQVVGTAVTNTVRADATGEAVSAPGMLFNTAAFTAPAAGLWGNAGRNTIPGPATFFLNGSIGRVFRFGERRSLDLQLQSQNLLNRVTITNWGTVLNSNNYGLATGAAGMRQLTANLRFRF